MGLDIDLYSIENNDLPKTEDQTTIGYRHWDYSDIKVTLLEQIVYYRKKYDIRDLFGVLLEPLTDHAYQLVYYEITKELVEKALATIALNDGAKDYVDLKDVLTRCLNDHNFQTHTLLFIWVS